MAPNIIRPSQMLIFNPAGMCYVEQPRHQAIVAEDDGDFEPMSPRPSPPAKRTYVKNISPEEKILRKKLRNREAAQLSRDKKKAQFNILSGMVHGLRKENLHLKEEIEVLRFNQEQLMAENERLREQLAADSSIPKPVTTVSSKPVTTESNIPVANDRNTIKGPAVSIRHPLQKGKRNRISCLMLCYQILFQLLIIPSFMIWNFQVMTIWIGLTSTCHNVWKKLPMNYSANFLNECCLDEMVGDTSEILESCQNIDDLHNVVIKDDPMLNTDTDTETVKIPNQDTQYSTPNIVNESKIEEQTVNENDALERFIIVEEAVEEVTTTYDEHILEICQEDEMDTEQYEDFGYESLSSPEYDCRTHYTPHLLTDLLS
ncbi:Basic-leucine zipper domain [Cinara cedri]|uniref:X-box-binding protein 1 n=1 Tax=Cinara cedri TaxID=506608 RepID=A0A5E4N9M5_9HEMI|nr:Basic-leucine zipper domain [Cinara cedri]